MKPTATHRLHCVLLLVMFIAAGAYAVAPDRSWLNLNLSADSPAQTTSSEDQEVAAVGDFVHVVETEVAHTNNSIRRLV